MTGQPTDPRTQADQAAAFAALEAIMAGTWDRYLHRFKGALNVRMSTDEYWNSIVAGSVPPVREHQNDDKAHRDE